MPLPISASCLHQICEPSPSKPRLCRKHNLTAPSVHNVDTLLCLVWSRPPGVPLITVSKHNAEALCYPFYSQKRARIMKWDWDTELLLGWDKEYMGGECTYRGNFYWSALTRKCIPITRSGGVYQEHMNEALERLNDGEWLHTFPEGKVNQEDALIRQLKWGTASLIVRAPITPIVLPIVHHGFQDGPCGSRECLGRGPPRGSGRCFNCGMDGHWARDCKAGDWKNKCYCCGERGHIERNCMNSPKKLRREQSYSRSLVWSRTELLGHFALSADQDPLTSHIR